MNVTLVLPLALIASALAIRMAVPVAQRIGLVDKPGGHKQHDRHVPLVGGLGIYTAVMAVLVVGALSRQELQPLFGALLLGTTLLFLVGMIDDMRQLSVRLRFAVQAVAATITALWGGIMLQDFGALISNDTLILGIMALPVTLFATTGVINALNMIDGVDGLSGSLSIASLTLLAVVAFNGGAEAYLVVILTLWGAVGGFLFFNLRCCRRTRARVFMGDAGSTLLGFLFACLFIGLSQGDSRAMSPVTALWLFAVPLFDTIAIMVRRVCLGSSPFSADRWHLHHLLLDAGFTVSQGILVMVFLQVFLGAVGLIGWYQAVPENVMFAGFLGLFTVYLYLASRPWRAVPRMHQLHRNLDLPVAGVRSMFIGGLPQGHATVVLHRLLGAYADDYGYDLYEHTHPVTGRNKLYALVDIGCEYTAPKVIGGMKARLRANEKVEVRQLIPRDLRHDRRQGKRVCDTEQRSVDRRSGVSRLVVHYTSSGSGASPQSDDKLRPVAGSTMHSQQARVERGSGH